MAGRRGGARTPARNTRMTRTSVVSGSPASGDRVTRSRKKTPPRVYETYEHQEVTQRTVTPSPGRRGDSSGSSRRMKDKTINHLYGLDDGSDIEEMTIESTSETSTFLDQSSSNMSLYKNVILLPFKYLYKLVVWVLALDTWLVSKSKTSRSSKRNSVLFFILLLLLPLILGLMCNNVYPVDVVNHLLSPVFGFGSFLSSIGASLASVFSRTETKYSTQDRMMFTSPIDKMDEKVKKLILNIGQNKDKLTAAEVEVIVRKLMQEEMAQFLSRIDSETGRHMARQVQINSDFESRLSSQQTLLTLINERAQQLALDLSTAKENIKIEQLNQRNGTALRLSDLDNELAALRRELLKIQTIQSDMMINLKSCCKNESYIVGLMKRLMHDEWYSASGGVGGKADDFNFWLQQQFVNKQAFEEKFRELADRLAREIRATERAESTQVIINTPNGTGLSEDHVRNLIQESLNVYSADKTGMVDYALESAGGSIISTRCSETYGKTAQLTLFGFPLWFVHQSPRTVIQPDVQPGQCWAFKGTQGYIVIQLSAAVHPTSFSMEHIPKQLSPTGNIDSAPKDFSVWGLQNEKQTRGVHLGDYVYDKNGSPLQFFPVKNINAGLFPIVELKIHSNHGNSDYTCIYRFRVHGVLQET